MGDYRVFPTRNEYGRSGTGTTGDEYDIYPPNGRHARDYYSYTRDHRFGVKYTLSLSFFF